MDFYTWHMQKDLDRAENVIKNSKMRASNKKHIINFLMPIFNKNIYNYGFSRLRYAITPSYSSSSAKATNSHPSFPKSFSSFVFF